VELIEEGHHLLPWFAHPSLTAQVPEDPKDFFLTYYAEAMKKARALKLPITLIASQWESGLSAKPYIGLPPEENPNVVAADGSIQAKVSPFGPVGPWREIGTAHTAAPRMRKLQEWYPHPPLVIFLSNNEHHKLRWHKVEESKRYLDRYGKGRDADSKRKIVADGWIERYRALQQGMRRGLVSPQWRANAVFIGYGAFGPEHMGRWGGWPAYALHSRGRIDPSPLMWDGGSPSYYTHNWNPSTDYRVWSPQVQFMNLVFMQREAHALNPRFWLEFSVWDGHQPTQENDKRKTYSRAGQSFTPERYSGFVQFGMWLLRPRAVREFRGWTHPWEKDKRFFMAIVAAVDRVHQNPILRRWWRRGELVPNRARQHPYQAAIPAEYRDADRWFLLETDAGPKNTRWSLTTEIPVFSLALVQGAPPARQWLLYAHSPLARREGVGITIPGHREVRVDVSVGGSFYLVHEKTGEATPVK